MKLHFKLIVAALGLSLGTKAQSVSQGTEVTHKRGCGTQAPAPEWDAWFNKKVEAYKEKLSASKQQNVSITIPVVVHVLHPGSQVGVFPNLTAIQIRSQINVLNKDFAGMGFNSNLLANTGFSVVGAANTHITFCLAQYDPSGNLLAEPGIDRINYNAMGWTNPSTPATTNAFMSLMDGTIKPATIWDPTSYFNIWISDVNPGTEILGYATFPGGSSLPGLANTGNGSTDGIWIWARSFGNTGFLQPPYNYGRTTTHETGHWLGLRHIGGDGNNNTSGDCNATDYCDDTPAQKGGYNSGKYGQNFGTPAYPLHAWVCGSPYGDMFMNFMDYTDDASCYMFTPDQNIRMQTALSEGFFRNQLSASAFTLCSGLPLADFVQDSISCVNSGLTPINVTSGDGTITYSWSVAPADGVSFSPGSADPNPTINFPGIGSYTISMIATNTIGVTTNTLAVRLEDCTGLKTNSLFDAGIRLMPNPSSGLLTISTDGRSAKACQVTVYNSLGQTVAEKAYDPSVTAALQLDLGALPDGVYSIQITNGSEKAVRRLILNK